MIGLTTTGAAKHQALVRQLGCRVLVMEEAAEVLEALPVAKRAHRALTRGDLADDQSRTALHLALDFEGDRRGVDLPLAEVLLKRGADASLGSCEIGLANTCGVKF